MMRLSIVIVALIFSSILCANEAPEVAELKLLNPLDEMRGWCVDLFADHKDAMPQGGFQGHTCFMYMGDGPTEDQGFDVQKVRDAGKFHLLYWDVCMTLHQANAGSFVAAEKCTDEKAQQFDLGVNGRITPLAVPELCLTLGAHSVPGGGQLAPVGTRPPKSNDKIHLIRRLTFEVCTEENAGLQRWGFRNVYAPEERSEPMRYNQQE